MASGMLVKGKWITERNDQDQNGKFHEKPTTFRDHITADGSNRAGFATSQVAYEEAVTQLFEHLDRWEMVLSQQRYLCGVGEASPKETQLTEADICMFTTLYRFDSVYYGHFKCNLRRIVDYSNLWNYLKDLYQRPEFKATCNQDYVKHSYYASMTDINPNQIVPKGPIINFDEPHDQDALPRFL
jgi:glutathionyl-hydroquinone reductase